MFIINSLKRQLLKVIEWKDESLDTMAYRFPMDDRTEIMNGSQLIVRESQTAILVSSGQIADVYGPGRHSLTTNNMPILTSLSSWKYGFNSPFKAEVYFVNTRQFIDQKWGTPAPIMMTDKDFGIIRFRSFGIYSFKVGNPAVFLREIFGTKELYRVSYVNEQLKKQIASILSESIAEANIPVGQLAANYTELSEVCGRNCAPKFERMGMLCTDITIQSITLDEESEKAISQRARMNILGNADEYTKFQAADAMGKVAENAHLGNNNMAGMGMGMGMGMAMTKMFTETVNTPSQPRPQPAPAAAPVADSGEKQPCPRCGTMVGANVKFCLECGEPVSRNCTKCSAPLPAKAKFCPKCGTPSNAASAPAQPVCAKCGNKLREGARFCTSCGTKVN